MEEQLKKTNTPAPRKSRLLIIFSGFAALFIAIGLVTVLTIHVVKNHQTPNKVAAVLITKKGFNPATLSVKQGTQIIWTNSDNSLHQIASNPYPKDNGLSNLKSEILNNNQTYEYTADTAGTFGYHDDQNPTINGTLVVQRK